MTPRRILRKCQFVLGHPIGTFITVFILDVYLYLSSWLDKFKTTSCVCRPQRRALLPSSQSSFLDYTPDNFRRHKHEHKYSKYGSKDRESKIRRAAARDQGQGGVAADLRTPGIELLSAIWYSTWRLPEYAARGVLREMDRWNGPGGVGHMVWSFLHLDR